MNDTIAAISTAQGVGAISIILGILFIAMGVLKLVEYYTADTKEDWLLTVALISVVLGIVILFASDAILSVFRVIVGLWIIATGIMDFQTTLVWKEVKSPYWTTAVLLSMLMMLAGIIILVNPNILFKYGQKIYINAYMVKYRLGTSTIYTRIPN